MHINDITIIDDSKLKKAITAAAPGNAMEWFDFGVYGFVAYALGGLLPRRLARRTNDRRAGNLLRALLVRPLGGLFFGAMGDKFGRQKVLSVTIIIMAVSTFCIGLIRPMRRSVSGHRSCCCWPSWRRASPSAVNIPVRQFSSPNTRRTANAALWAAGWTSAPSPAL